MGVPFSSLTSDQQDQLSTFVDTLHRPTLLGAWKLMRQFDAMLSEALASPSGQASSASSPASDSIWGVLLGLTGSETVPIVSSGLSGAQPIQAQVLLANLGTFATILAAQNTDSARQSFALAVGAVNVGT